MKVTMVFDMSDPDDRVEHKHAIQGSGLACALFDFDQWLRAEAKYEARVVIDIDEAREKLREFVAENGLVFDQIVYSVQSSRFKVQSLKLWKKEKRNIGLRSIMLTGRKARGMWGCIFWLTTGRRITV